MADAKVSGGMLDSIWPTRKVLGGMLDKVEDVRAVAEVATEVAVEAKRLAKQATSSRCWLDLTHHMISDQICSGGAGHARKLRPLLWTPARWIGRAVVYPSPRSVS